MGQDAFWLDPVDRCREVTFATLILAEKRQVLVLLQPPMMPGKMREDSNREMARCPEPLSAAIDNCLYYSYRPFFLCPIFTCISVLGLHHLRRGRSNGAGMGRQHGRADLYLSWTY